jgi:Co/Zn/Cd efflux system component
MGVIAVDVPAGEHQIDARFGTTPARTLGAAISGLMLAGVLVLIFWPQRGREANP